MIPTSLGSGTSTGVQSSNSFVMGNAILAKDSVFIFVQINSSSSVPTVSSISDGSNSYALISRVTISSVGLELWAASNCTSVSNGSTITATWSGSNGGAGAAHAILGTRSPGLIAVPLDKTATPFTSASSAAPTTSTGTLTTLPELIIAGNFSGNGGTLTQANGFTALNSVSQSGNENGMAYLVVQSSVTSVTYSPTWSASGLCGLLMASFKGVSITGFNQPMLGM